MASNHEHSLQPGSQGQDFCWESRISHIAAHNDSPVLFSGGGGVVETPKNSTSGGRFWAAARGRRQGIYTWLMGITSIHGNALQNRTHRQTDIEYLITLNMPMVEF